MTPFTDRGTARRAAQDRSTYQYSLTDRNGNQTIYTYKKSAAGINRDKLLSKDIVNNQGQTRHEGFGGGGEYAKQQPPTNQIVLTRTRSDNSTFLGGASTPLRRTTATVQAPNPLAGVVPAQASKPTKQQLITAQKTLRQLNESAARSGSGNKYYLTQDANGEFQITTTKQAPPPPTPKESYDSLTPATNIINAGVIKRNTDREKALAAFFER